MVPLRQTDARQSLDRCGKRALAVEQLFLRRTKPCPRTNQVPELGPQGSTRRILVSTPSSSPAAQINPLRALHTLLHVAPIPRHHAATWTHRRTAVDTRIATTCNADHCRLTGDCLRSCLTLSKTSAQNRCGVRGQFTSPERAKFRNSSTLYALCGYLGTSQESTTLP